MPSGLAELARHFGSRANGREASRAAAARSNRGHDEIALEQPRELAAVIEAFLAALG